MHNTAVFLKAQSSKPEKMENPLRGFLHTKVSWLAGGFPLTFPGVETRVSVPYT